MPVVKRMRLTKVMVERVKPRKAPYRLWDSEVPGLALRILPTGRSTYELHWANNRSLALGTNGVMTLAGARSAARRVIGEVEKHGAPLKPSARGRTDTFGEYLDNRYGPHIEAVNKAGKQTMAALRKQFGHLAARPLRSIHKADFDSFKAERLAAGRAPATVNRDMDRLKAALSQAEEWGLLTENPLRGVKRIKRGIEDRTRYLTQEEEVALRRALEAREDVARTERESGNAWRRARKKEELPAIEGYSDGLTPMVLLALNTGLRRGELTQLRWDDINLTNRMLTVRAGYAKSGTARHVTLNSEAVEVLRVLRKQQHGSGRLFPVKSVSRSFKSVLASAEIEDFRFHDLRHTFASNLVMRGVPLNTVRELLGHSDISMTLRYAHLEPSHKADAVELLVRS